MKQLKNLSPDELQTAELVWDELSNKEIADRLHLTEKAIEARLARIYQKIGVRTRIGLIKYLMKNQIQKFED